MLLLTQTDIYIVEIKNYNGDFKYADSQCYFSDNVISHNPISADENSSLNNGTRPLYYKKTLRIIEGAELNSPYQPQPLTLLEQANLRRGIKCANCSNFDLDTARSYLICNCGLHEPRGMAIVRTICEYGILNFDKDLHIAEQNMQKNGLVFVNSTKKFNDVINTFPFTRDRYLIF